MKVAIMMGSQSDAAVMGEAGKILQEFGIGYDMRVLSAHRSPKETAAYAEEFRSKGGEVFICGAGMSAALSGVVAAHTTLPVIGVPLDASSVQGMDALLSTAQMPPGVPVGAVAIGKAGAKNAAYLAIRIMSLKDETLTKKLEDFQDAQRKKILAIKL
ncbi:MAG: 5-(carboxyamino)imidazole ribonucleotide mutase [Candidatus Omnitrophica bacterium]|nr:5-(carboxyamino)imidazole ribonucleotide mutase [Candidatus Omnitrophota bacterium]